MRLYYLTKLDTAKLILKERRMKLSLFGELNDPFELLGASIGDKLARRVFKVILSGHWSQTLGLICFSDTWQSPVMWAHYGDKHHGVCLGFDVRDDLAQEVQYKPDRLKNMLEPTKPLLGLDDKKLKAVLLTKYQDWAYEHEWRVFAPLKERDKNGKFYVDFGPHMMLGTVILGARCIASIPDMVKLLGKVEQPVKFWKARPGFREFEIVRQQRVPKVTVR
jgi:Protein of unknown function (DUF2971)